MKKIFLCLLLVFSVTGIKAQMYHTQDGIIYRLDTVGNGVNTQLNDIQSKVLYETGYLEKKDTVPYELSLPKGILYFGIGEKITIMSKNGTGKEYETIESPIKFIGSKSYGFFIIFAWMIGTILACWIAYLPLKKKILEGIELDNHVKGIFVFCAMAAILMQLVLFNRNLQVASSVASNFSRVLISISIVIIFFFLSRFFLKKIRKRRMNILH